MDLQHRICQRLILPLLLLQRFAPAVTQLTDAVVCELCHRLIRQLTNYLGGYDTCEFAVYNLNSTVSRRDLLSMYLPQEAQKSFTAALFALGGVVSRPATEVVKNGSQIADRFSITWFS